MSLYNSNILLYYTLLLLGGCSSNFFTQWRHLSICHMVAESETISVKCTEHGYQHSASDLALILCTGLYSRWVVCKKLLWRHL